MGTNTDWKTGDMNGLFPRSSDKTKPDAEHFYRRLQFVDVKEETEFMTEVDLDQAASTSNFSGKFLRRKRN
jgi:hypothetical protein